MNTKEIKKQAYSHFESGHHCAEVITQTILSKFAKGPHPDAVKAASIFGGGIAGTTEELCGAFTGGIVSLGILMGREHPTESIKEAAKIAKAFKQQFSLEFGSLNCAKLIKGFAEKEDHFGCAKLTAKTTAMLAEMLEEYGKKHEADMSFSSYQPHQTIEPGTCPFTGCSCR
jgi:C_GCAxxG_C_C family probable redox protein